MKPFYELIVRAGMNGGPVEPPDGRPFQNIGEAISAAKDFLPKCHEVVIIQKTVARRMQGDLCPSMGPEGTTPCMKDMSHEDAHRDSDGKEW